MGFWDGYDTPTQQAPKPVENGGVGGFIRSALGSILGGVAETGGNLLKAGSSFKANEVQGRAEEERRKNLIQKQKDFEQGKISEADLKKYSTGSQEAASKANKIVSSANKDFQSIDRTKAAANAADAAVTLGTLGTAGLVKGVVQGGVKKAIGRGIGEGATLGATYGALDPLKERGSEATQDEIINSAIGGGALGGVGGGILGGVLGKVAKEGTTETPKILSGLESSLENKAAANMLKLNPSQAQKLLDAGIDTTKLAQRAAQFGKSAEEIIGATGKGGPLQQTIKSLEDGIQTTANRGGKNIRIDTTDIIKGLEKEAKAIKKELGGSARADQLKKVINDAKVKYKNGVTVKQALSTLREANAQFGKSILDDSGDAVIKAAQKLEANTLRQALKGRFPSISKGLDDQAELIQLRELLQSARAKEKVGGFKTGKVDLTRPGSFIDPLLNSKTMSQGVLNRAAKRDSKQELASQLTGLSGSASPVRGVLSTALQQQVGRTSADMANPEEIPMEDATQQLDWTGEGFSDPYAAQGETSPFSRENIQNLILQDLQGNGGKNVTSLLKLYETFGSTASKEKPLSAEASKVVGNANSGLKSLSQLENIISGQGGEVSKATLVPGRELFGNLGGNVLGTAEFDNASKNLADVITRLRTGAALTDSEEAFYKSQLPQAFDSPEVIAQKLGTFRDLFNSVASRTGTAGTDIQAQLGEAL